MDAWLTAALWCVVAVVTIAVILAAVRTRRPVRNLLTSGIQGMLALGIVNTVGACFHAALGVSWMTLGVSCVLGIPGVITLLLAKLILPI